MRVNGPFVTGMVNTPPPPWTRSLCGRSRDPWPTGVLCSVENAVKSVNTER
jgi:hypothetical protein